MTIPLTGIAPVRRIAAFYGTFFMSSGVWTVVGSIWLDGRGLTSVQIGAISIAPVLVMLLLNMVVGRIADRASDWRQVIVLGNVISGVLAVGLLWADGFWSLLVIWTVAAIAQMASGPVVDAAAMRFCKRNGHDFASIRAFGSIGYLALLVATGYLARFYGAGVFLPLFIGTALLRAAMALSLPKFRGETAAPGGGATRLMQVMRPWFVLPLVGWAMVFATHLILNSFQNLLWQRQGLTLDVIGNLIALGALAETAMFFAFRRFAHRFSARAMILTSGVISVLRWIAMSWEPGVPVLVAMQLLHSVTYALGFLACLGFITKWTAEDIAAEAQGFFVMLQQAMAVIGVYIFGLIADRYGAQAYLASAGFAVLGSALIGLSMVLKHPDREAKA